MTNPAIRTVDAFTGATDSTAKLEQLVVQGKTYTLTGDGVRAEETAR